MGEYIRVRFRTRPPLVASPSRLEQSQLNQLNQSQLSSRQNKPKPATIFSLIHAKQGNRAPINARKAQHRALQAPSIVGYYERVRIDWTALCLSIVLHLYATRYTLCVVRATLSALSALPFLSLSLLDPCSILAQLALCPQKNALGHYST